jgi:restriction system protein
MNVVALLLWWAGIVLAVLSYLMLHAIASRPVAPVTQLAQMSGTVTQTRWKTLANFGQYMLPIICLAGAGISAWRRKIRQDLVTNTVESKATDTLDGMSWQEFETLTAEAFRLQGYLTLQTIFSP